MDEDTPYVDWKKSLISDSSFIEIEFLHGNVTKILKVVLDPQTLIDDGLHFNGQIFDTDSLTFIHEFADPIKDNPNSTGAMFDTLDMDFFSSDVEYPCGCRWILSTYIKEKTSQDLGSMIIHLNDGHRWSREKIADWLDELHDSGVVNLIVEEKK